MAFLYPTRGPAGGCCSVWWPGYVLPWAPSRVHLVGRSPVPLVSGAQREVCLIGLGRWSLANQKSWVAGILPGDHL